MNFYKNYLEQARLKLELKKSEQKLKDRIVIDKAKGIIMNRFNTTEEEAYKRLRQLSMEKEFQLLSYPKL